MPEQELAPKPTLEQVEIKLLREELDRTRWVFSELDNIKNTAFRLKMNKHRTCTCPERILGEYDLLSRRHTVETMWTENELLREEVLALKSDLEFHREQAAKFKRSAKNLREAGWSLAKKWDDNYYKCLDGEQAMDCAAELRAVLLSVE